MDAPTTVVVLNSNQDLLELLCAALERVGVVVISGQVDELRRGRQSLSDIVQEHNPSVLIYDLVPPYDRNWRFLEHLQSTPAVRDRPFIVTAANAAAARELCGDSCTVYEILGKPYDIDVIVDAVQRAASGEPSGQPRT